MKERSDGYFQISLMNVFRQAARERDASKDDTTVTADGGRMLSTRSVERREGASQATLRDHLARDLSGLLSTINLESALDLDGLDHVRASVLNYGMQDLTRLTTEDIRTLRLSRDLRDSLLAHEPRLIADSLVVKLRKGGGDRNQRVCFDIQAEMSARPVDVPLEFEAEIDTGAGKVALTNLVVRG
ncbi:MAG TPA: type VI secretion system baseplate subunit TssE [Rhodobacter sp.]|nr:type VI secretion system baseplate subunit TssE [Rhodobacter sp.]